MKINLLILLMIVPIFLFAEREPVMLKVVSKNFTFSSEGMAIFRMGVEEILTNDYRLIDEAAQEEALREQSTQQKKSCYDDSCLVDVGKMIAARGIFLVEVLKVGSQYAFKMRYIDIEQATTERTKSMFYKGSLTNGEKMLEFSKKLSRALLGYSGGSTVKRGPAKTYQRNYRLSLRSSPSSARIYDNNNRYLGTTPLTLNIPKGTYKYRFSKQGYYEQTKTVYLSRNQSVTASLTSSSIVNITFKLSTSPAADVYINGQLKGKTPLKLAMKKGYHNLELRAGSLRLTKRIYVSYSTTFKYALYDYVPMTITSTPSGASVSINGKHRGVTPLIIDRIESRSHKIYLYKSGYYSKTVYFTPSRNYNKKSVVLSKRSYSSSYSRRSYSSSSSESGMMFGFSTMEYFSVKDPSDSLEYSGMMDVLGFYAGIGAIEEESDGQSRFYLMGYVPLMRLGMENSSYSDGSNDYSYNSDIGLVFLTEPSVKLMYGWTFGEMFHFDFGVKAHYSELIPSDAGGVVRFGIGYGEDDEFWMSFFAVELFYGIQKNFIVNVVLLDFFGILD